MKKAAKIILGAGFLAFTALVSCVQDGAAQKNEGKYAVRILDASDGDQLGKLINLEKFRPEKVTFRYIFIDSSGQNNPDYLPGLTEDNSLQAVLYFDSATFERMREQASLMDYKSVHFKKETFNFEFLDKKVRQELMHSAEKYQGHPDLFFESKDGKLWLLDRKILFSK
jgi:hypothetical protein